MTVTHDNPASQADLGEMRPRERRWNNRGRGKRSSQITGTMIIAACCSRVPGALAAPFADKAALKTAVINCLAAVPHSGENCCSSDSDCADPTRPMRRRGVRRHAQLGHEPRDGHVQVVR